jgi:lysine-N-methylase
LDQGKQALNYAARFVCVGGECEDTCCSGWTVPVDQQTLAGFESLPEGQLKSDVVAAIERKTPPSPHFAVIRMNEQHRCPLQAGSGLCRVHAELGEQALPVTCQQYPRYKQMMNSREEVALALSCPEAARLVLFTPDLLGPEGPKLHGLGSPNTHANQPLHVWADRIRALVLWLVAGNRKYPLWQRLFMIRLLCHRLDHLRETGTEHMTPVLLAEIEASLVSGSLRPALDQLPSSTEAQLDVVLQLAGLMLEHSNLTPRFLESVNAFTTGIGNGPNATLASLAEGYETAQELWFEPFLARYPQMLENWLVNAIIRHRFPFGWQSKEENAPTTAVQEFDGLAANFALMRGMLIGVAGFYREAFSQEHVVHTVQAASKHFEHHPEFLPKARLLLIETGLADARGSALLLHEGVRKVQRPMAPAVGDQPESAVA